MTPDRLEDLLRTDAIERAIRALVRDGTVVLDPAAGVGVYALLAARRGGKVHAVESSAFAEVIRDLARVNGVPVAVHRSVDAVPEPAAVILADPTARFGFDGPWAERVEAAAARLAPGGVFVPSAMRLVLAPVGDVAVPACDAPSRGLYGLDLRPLLAYAANQAHEVRLPAESLLAAAAEVAAFTLPAMTPFARDLTFSFERGGRLQGFAGWFEATLAPGIALSTAPGVAEACQLLFPVPAADVEPGDAITVSITGDRDGFRWEGELRRGIESPEIYGLESDTRWGERGGHSPSWSGPRDRAAVEALVARGHQAMDDGATERARELFEEAARRVSPADDDLAPAVYEGLGMTLYALSEWPGACRAFLRALDGSPSAAGGVATRGAREPSLRFLVLALFRSGRPEAEGMLARYETAFGPHPYFPR
jgi:hypothetical protein